MLAIYRSGSIPKYLDAPAADLLAEGRENFVRYKLDRQRLLEAGSSTYVFLWSGDRIANTVIALLTAVGLSAVKDGLAVSVSKITPVELVGQLTALLAGPVPDPIELASMVQNKVAENFHGLLPEALLNTGYAGRSLNVTGAWHALSEVLLAEIPS